MEKPSAQGAGKRRAIILFATVATVVYVAAGFAVDAPRVREAISALGWLGCLLVLALSVANYLIRFERWHMFLRRLGHRLPGLQHLMYYLGGFAFTVSPAKAGEAVRSIYLHQHGVSYSESIAALFVERLQDLLAMALLASLVLADRPTYRPLVVGALLIVVAVLLVTSHRSLPGVLERLAARHFTGPRLSSVFNAGIKLLRSSALLLAPKLLLLGTFVGLLSWGGEGMGFFLVCRGLEVHLALLPALGVYALAVLAGTATFFLPAGIGGMEVVMTTLLVSHGAPLRIAIIATLLCRVATLWFAVIIGIVAATAVEFKAHSPGLRVAS